MICKRCGRKSSGNGEQCSACAQLPARESRRSRKSGRTPRVFSAAELAASEAVTAPVVFASQPAPHVPGKGPLPLVAQFPHAAGAAGGPPLLEPAPPEAATRELHRSMLPPSLGPGPDGAVTEMLPAYALPFQFASPDKPLPPLPRPGPPGPPLSEQLRAKKPSGRSVPPNLKPRRRSGEFPRLFSADLPRQRKRPAASAQAPEAPSHLPSLFAHELPSQGPSFPLLALALAGLVTGLGGGYWLLQGREEAPPAAVSAPAPAPAPARAALAVSSPALPPAGKVVRASHDEAGLGDVEPTSLVRAMKPRPGAPALTVVRAEGQDGADAGR